MLAPIATTSSTKSDWPASIAITSGVSTRTTARDQSRRPIITTHARIQRRFGQWLEKAGIKRKLSPHGLRHSMATNLYRKTGDILLVKEALHHRSIASTMVYARADREQLRTALA